MTAFPTEEVSRITGASFKPDGVTTVALSGAQLRALVACGAADPDDSHNNSLTNEELLEHFGADPGAIFEGAIIWPSDPDARVRIANVALFRSSLRRAQEIERAYAESADYRSVSRELDGTYLVRLFWK
jgi:hypothetical protein